MATRLPERPDLMLQALHAERPNEALASKLRLYGQFVGSWDLDVDYHPLNGPKRSTEGEWHFSWVLDGKAIQDVWIFPARRLRGGERSAEPWYLYGSTFRWYDPAIDAWHITWFDPTRPFELRQIGRAAGADIVQIGEDHHGVIRRWRFVEITDQSFRWIGDVSWDKGSTWTLEMECGPTKRRSHTGDGMTRDTLVARWSELGDKTVTLAEEFPADKFEFRPAPDVRSFADQLRHIAFWNAYVRKTLRREQADGEANELPRDAYPTKTKVVTALRESFDAVTTQIAKSDATPDASDADTLLTFIEHTGEHYGQLVVYYRLNGLVPPASRGNK